MTRARFAQWLKGYERAWRTAGTDSLAALFAPGARYRMSPYEEWAGGLEAIGALWEDERDGPDEGFQMTADVVAVEGHTGVARVKVNYDVGDTREFVDLWIVRFDHAGLCVEFEEWAYWPERSARSGR
jgi:SnoaL-like domain